MGENEANRVWTRIDGWEEAPAKDRSRPFRKVHAVLTHATGATTRAVLVALLVATPSLLMSNGDPDNAQVVALIALFAGILTMVEYSAKYPSLVEFRDAPPFNRIRFSALFFTVFVLSIMGRDLPNPSGLDIFMDAVGLMVGHALDFPYSPIRLMLLSLPETASPATINAVRSAAGFAYFAALFALLVFYYLLKLHRWPSASGAFNVWINLPTFDPTAGGDVVDRLNRDARYNLALGFLLPFLIPAVAKAATSLFGPVMVDAPQALVWMVALWAFLPLSLFMRGIAMGRVATMITEMRRRTSAAPHSDTAVA